MIVLTRLTGLLTVLLVATVSAFANDVPRHLERAWPKTDFSQRTVALEEIRVGGPSKDGIPAVDDPQFVEPDAAAQWLEPREPVIALRVGDDARAYPLQILIWHEIVNDVVGGQPVAVTFCPLCNASLVFDRRRWPCSDGNAHGVASLERRSQECSP